MKTKTFLTFILIFYLVFDVCWAQPYESIFGKDTIQWNFYEFTTSSEYTLLYRILDNIDIDSNTYKIIYSYGCGKNGDENCRIAGYIREDTLSGKGFFRYPNEDKDYIVWDFSLEESDTFFFETLNGHIASINIDSTNTIDGRKYLYTNMLFPEDLIGYLRLNIETVTFIEGVGATNGIIYLSQSLSSYLLCSYKNKDLIYSGYEECDVNRVGINKIDENKPFILTKLNDWFIFSFENYQSNDIKINIYNLQGQLIEKIISEDKHIEYSPKISNCILIYKTLVNGKIYSGLLL